MPPPRARSCPPCARAGALPAGWDVLHLSLCDATPQAWAGPGVRLFSRGFCTLGTLYTRRARAARPLRAAEVGLRNVDNLLLDLALTGALAFIARLAGPAPGPPRAGPARSTGSRGQRILSEACWCEGVT